MREDRAPAMRVVIVGGGTAGWMTAAALARYLGRSVDLALIESDAIGTVGVGEATIPQIRLFNEGLGIEERAFLKGTSGTIKLGIRFEDWHRVGASYFHGFGGVGRDPGLVPFHHYWLRWRSEGGALGLDEFCPNAIAAREGRFGPAEGAVGARMPASAYHFDAARYAAFLRRYAEARGAVRREGRVTGVERDALTGDVARVHLEGGGAIEGDLFVDCSGFRALLLGEALGVPFLDWSHWLPCDRALAVPCEGGGALDPFTRATAKAAGWQWRIPLQHRVGNGHVYASAFTSDEAAHETLMAGLPGRPLAEPRPLRFRAGRRAALWSHNCVAVGLAGGFLEPLESTSIHLIQSGIARLLALFPHAGAAPALAAEYNAQAAFEYESIRDFLVLHYHATARGDSAFWDHCRTMQVPDTLAEKIALFAEEGRIVRFNSELFDVPSWVQVFLGQGIAPARHHPMVDAAAPADLARFIERARAEARAQVDALGDHGAFVARMAAA